MNDTVAPLFSLNDVSVFIRFALLLHLIHWIWFRALSSLSLFHSFSFSLSLSFVQQALADALLADPELLARSVEELFESGTIAELLRLARALPDNVDLQASIASILRCAVAVFD